jgi:dimethylhistidine N-methyltransferase
MEQYKKQIAQQAGPHCLLLEYGSGSSLKTHLLLDHLSHPCAYISIDICPEYLNETKEKFRVAYPNLEILPVYADFTKPFHVPDPGSTYARKMIYFPGSTIGNFAPYQATVLLKNMRSLCGRQDMVLLGVDLKKDKNILNRAYNDRGGFTAAFNINLLQRINDELDANIALENFQHRAFYNEVEGRVEMHLRSICPQAVTIDNKFFFFYEGENIQTEFSYKYDLTDLNHLAQSAGFRVDQMWTDTNKFFAVALLTVA